MATLAEQIASNAVSIAKAEEVQSYQTAENRQVHRAQLSVLYAQRERLTLRLARETAGASRRRVRFGGAI